METKSSGKLLCLDGGGVRGMVEARILDYIETKTKRKIKDSFEWIAGTSTGGLIALYLGLNHSANECLELYKALKNKVFSNKSYKILIENYMRDVKSIEQYERAIKDNSNNLEKVLKQYFGERTKIANDALWISGLYMSIKELPIGVGSIGRIIITVTDGKQDPLKLLHFTNFDDEYKNTLVWKVARATAAAPGFFPKFKIDNIGPLFDGGLTANNPTLTTLSYIHSYFRKKVLRFNMKACVSLGTGLMPVINTELPELPTGAFDLFSKWMSGELRILIKMLANELARTDGYLIDEAKAFCSIGNIKYFRLNPEMSTVIDLSEVKDNVLNKMIKETDFYIDQNRQLIDQIFE